MGTGVATFLLRNSHYAYMNPFLFLGLTFGSVIALNMTDYHNSFLLKNMLYGGFITLMGLSLVPLVHAAGMPVIYDALIASGVIVGALGTVAYNAPSQ